MSYDEPSVKAAEENTPAIVPAAGETAYFTEGEMLPWKNRWFQVHLITQDGQKYIQLEMLKPTAASSKRLARAERWSEQHPRAEHDCNGKLIARMSKSLRSAGQLSGSQASAPDLESTTPSS